MPVEIILSALAGALIGSFLNVCIFRIPRDLSVVTPRSFCPRCEHPVAAFDNVPLLSWLLLRGRCRHCGGSISPRYPLVELLTALAFGCVAARYGWNLSGLKWTVFEALMIVLFFTDLETRILPDEFTLGGTVAAILFAFFVYVPGVAGELLLTTIRPAWQSLANLAIAAILLPGPLWLAAEAYGRIRKVDALGFGDVKLLLLLGCFLGFGPGLLALTLGAVAGALVGIPMALVARQKLSSFEVPFGSFLCGASALLPLLAQAAGPQIRY